MNINLRSGTFSNTGPNLVFKSNIENTVIAIKFNEIESVVFAENKMLIHPEVKYGFRLGFMGILIIVIGGIILYSVYPDGYYSHEIFGFIMLFGTILFILGTLIFISMSLEAFVGLDLHSKLLLSVFGKKIGTLNILTENNINNINIYTYPDEAVQVDQLIKFIENLKKNDTQST